jgi:xylulokinase
MTRAAHSAAEYVLAIDLGSSGPKVGVVSAQGVVHGSAFRPVVTFEVADGGLEQNPEAVWRAVVEASHEALRTSGVSPVHVVAVICDSHFFSLVALGHDGQPTMNLMFWADRRGRHDNLRRYPGYRPDTLWRQYQWWRIHGIPPMKAGVDNISKLRWIKYARPEVYARTAVFLEPMDYLAYRLTGRATANACTAFPLQLTDNRTAGPVTYDDRLCRYAGIDREKLPELLPVDSIIGEILPGAAAELGLAPGTKVITGVNDTQAGAVGCGAFQGDHAGIVLGSSGVLVSHTPRKKTDVRSALFSLPSPVPNAYLVTGEGGSAGRALEHFLEAIVFGEDDFGAIHATDRYQRLESVLAASPPGSNGVLFLPWMSGSIAPAPDTHMRGGFLNLSLNTRRADMARAVLEGIGFLYQQMAQSASHFTGRAFSHYALYGGGALSNTWSQTMADILQAPVHRMAQPRLTNCLGLGLLAFERLGRLGFDDIARRVPADRVFDPDPALQACYAEKSAAMRLAFKQNRGLFRTLNRTVDEETLQRHDVPGTYSEDAKDA